MTASTACTTLYALIGLWSSDAEESSIARVSETSGDSGMGRYAVQTSCGRARKPTVALDATGMHVSFATKAVVFGPRR